MKNDCPFTKEHEIYSFKNLLGRRKERINSMPPEKRKVLIFEEGGFGKTSKIREQPITTPFYSGIQVGNVWFLCNKVSCA
jgi:hypothetical protein